MATQPTPGSAVAAFPATPPMPAVARILARFEREQLAGFIAVALDLIDTLDGDADLEDNADREANDGDEQDVAWIEWNTMHGPQKRGHNRLAGEEDDEDDDPPEDDDSDRCLAGEDRIVGGPALYADAMGFSSRPNRYCIGMDEDIEPPLPAA